MTAWRSALYTGEVTHRRLRPIKHRLRYKVFYLLIDLDELDDISRSLRLFSHNRLNLFCLFDRDHGNGSNAPLREQVDESLREIGIQAGGSIALLAMPRLFGYAFNPISTYFCRRGDGALIATLYEVNNTFGQRHNYLIPVESSFDDMVRQECRKSLYVSPFMGMDMQYYFAFRPPDENLSLTISGQDVQGSLIVANLRAKRRPLTDRSLVLAAIFYPLMTFKVVVGIWWEALMLRLKGVRVHPRPRAPAHVTTIGSQIHVSSSNTDEN